MAQGHTSDEASGSGNNDLDAMVDYMNNHLPDYVFTIMRNRSPTHFNFPMLRPRYEGCHKDSLHMACPGMACHFLKPASKMVSQVLCDRLAQDLSIPFGQWNAA